MARKPASRTKGWSVEVEGLKEVGRRLEKMPSILRLETGEALMPGAELIADRAGQLAPVGKSGGLQNSIIVEGPFTEREGFGKTSVSLGAQGIDGAMVWIGPDSDHWYGIFPELGTSHSSAEPYMRPAFDELKNIVVQSVGAKLFATVERFS